MNIVWGQAFSRGESSALFSRSWRLRDPALIVGQQLHVAWWGRPQILPFTSNAMTHSHWHVINGLGCQNLGFFNDHYLLCNVPLMCLICVLSSPRTSCWPVPDLWETFVLWTSACPDAWTTSQKSGRSWARQSMLVSPVFSPPNTQIHLCLFTLSAIYHD